MRKGTLSQNALISTIFFFFLFSIKLRAYYTIVKHTRKFCGNCLRFRIVTFRSKNNLSILKSAQS